MLKLHRNTIFETLGRNSIHPFPARMAPGIALEALGECNVPLRVLDPMAGSGTVLAVARSKGHWAIGVDIDPLAVLLADVWTRTVDSEGIKIAASNVLSRAKVAFKSLSAANAYPTASDQETRTFIRFWFDEYARRQLAALSFEIHRVRDEATRNVLWCGFSRLIITKTAGTSLAMDLSHSRPHRAFDRAPVKPFDRFISAVERVVSNCPKRDNMQRVGPAAVVKQGDARELSVRTASVDLVLTSPPYLNAIDYMRCSKFSLSWMGYNIGDLRKIRGESVGTETSSEQALGASWVRSIIDWLELKPKLSSRHYAMLCQYVWDMGRALSEASRVLRPGGRAVYVVGDSTIRGTFIRNSAIVTAVAEEHGLRLATRKSRSLPPNRRYMPPPKQNNDVMMNGRMRQEVVLTFNKSA